MKLTSHQGWVFMDFHVQLLILFSYFEFFLSSAPEEVKRVFSLQNANQVQLTPDNLNLALTQTKIDFPWISVIRFM